MGNFLSCTTGAPAAAASRSARVILPSGDTRKFDSPVSVAEIMLDMPDHFATNAVDLQIGKRFSALAADEELEVGGVYAMVPFGRLSSVITPADVASLLMAVTGKTAPAVFAPEGTLEKVGGMDEMQLRRYGMGRCRSRKPMLETIAEESRVLL